MNELKKNVMATNFKGGILIRIRMSIRIYFSHRIHIKNQNKCSDPQHSGKKCPVNEPKMQQVGFRHVLGLEKAPKKGSTGNLDT